jgi:ATP-binding cassette, subfamily C (CFTR/MRP), member 4
MSFSFWFDIVTFRYVNKLLRKGIKTTITLDDFDEIVDQDNCKKFEVLLLNFEDGLIHALLKTFGYAFLWIWIGCFLEIGLRIGSGYMLGQILKSLQELQDPIIGYYYALGLVVIVFSHSVLRHMIYFNASRIGMQVRASLTAAIYNKCLSLSTWNTSSSGAIVNLISNDVQKFEDCAPWLHFIWASPIGLCSVWYFIYLELGWVACAPIIILLLMFPLQGVLAKQFAKLRSKTLLLRDDWLKFVSDLISGILTVKLYAWEIPFIDSILAIRSKEIGLLKLTSLLQALTIAFSNSSSGMVW